jgi:hypothetical protein
VLCIQGCRDRGGRPGEGFLGEPLEHGLYSLPSVDARVLVDRQYESPLRETAERAA